MEKQILHVDVNNAFLSWLAVYKLKNGEKLDIREQVAVIGNSITLPMDISNKEELEEVLVALTEQVTYRLRKQELLANVVSVQLRTKNFEDFSHQYKLYSATSSTKEILKSAKSLLNEMFKQGMFIRLIGVRVDNLVSKDAMQMSLFGDSENEKKQKNLDKVIDSLNEKYGYDSIMRAGKLNSGYCAPSTMKFKIF